MVSVQLPTLEGTSHSSTLDARLQLNLFPSPPRYILLHARDITAAFPLDLHDHELEFAEGPPERPPEETVLTSLIERFKAFRYSEKVTEELLRFPYSYSTALFRRAD